MNNINRIIQDLGLASYFFIIASTYLVVISFKEIAIRLKNKIWFWIARGKIVEENEKIDKRIDKKILPLIEIAKRNEKNIEKISNNIILREEGQRSHHRQIRHIVTQQQEESVLHELLDTIQNLNKYLEDDKK